MGKLSGQEQYDDLVNSNRDAILRKHEEAVTRIRECLHVIWSEDHGHQHVLESQCSRIEDILDALAVFNPMHAEDWKGWPQ